MTIEIWLGLALTISVGLNLLLIWFSREQSRRLSYVSQNLGDLVELISDYGEHLRRVYSMEMFYGDQTLEFLMEHTRSLISMIQKEYGDITSITEPLEVIIIEEEDEENEKEIQGENVLYAGTRTSNN